MCQYKSKLTLVIYINTFIVSRLFSSTYKSIAQISKIKYCFVSSLDLINNFDHRKQQVINITNFKIV